MSGILGPDGKPIPEKEIACDRHVPVPIEFVEMPKRGMGGVKILRAARLYCFNCNLTMGMKPEFYYDLDQVDAGNIEP